MHERAETLGGWVRIDSAPGSGTVIEVWLPQKPHVLTDLPAA